MSDRKITDLSAAETLDINSSLTVLPIVSPERVADVDKNRKITWAQTADAMVNQGMVKGPGSSVNNNFAVFDGVTGALVKDAGFKPADYLPLAGGTVTGVVDLQAQVRRTPGADLGVTGTITLDFNGPNYRSTGTLTGPITFASDNLASGRSVTVRVRNGGTTQDLFFPAGWVFIGNKPNFISSGKTGVLTVMAFGSSNSDVVAAWGAQQ